MNGTFMDLLACPRDGTAIREAQGGLACEHGHFYPVVLGTPVMLVPEERPNHWTIPNALKLAGSPAPETAVDPDVWTESDGINSFVQKWIVKSSGYLYRPLKGRLSQYPIPELRLPPGNGRTLVDVGCNWGRWTVAAARQGYRCIGVDPNLNAITAARRVCAALGVTADFVVADARHLPFRTASVDTVYSYSVLQHFSRNDALASLAEAGRILGGSGTCLVQMPNKFGLRCLYHQARRGFAEGEKFEVRYWTIPALKRAFTQTVGPPEVSVDGFLGLGIQARDAQLLPWFERTVVGISERLRRASLLCPSLGWLADSLFLQVRRTGHSRSSITAP